jgi:hypothetical protein
MLGLYLFALGLGGVLLAATFFADADGHDHLGHSDWHQLFSMRNITYFLFVFGAIGSLLAWARGGRTTLLDGVAATTTAALVSALVNYVFGWVRKTDDSEVPSDVALVGRPAMVTLPIGREAIGKVELTFGGQRVELLARPYGSEEPEIIGNGTEVVIVEMVAGTALVSRTSTNSLTRDR